MVKEVVTHWNRILILAPTGEDTTVLYNALKLGGLAPSACQNISELCRGIDEISGTAIIAEESITPKTIALLYETILHQPEWSDFPLIIMSGAGSNSDRVWACLSGISQSLNVSVLERPLLTRTLLSAVRSSLRSRNSQYRIAEELRRRKEIECLLTIANDELQTFSYSVSHDLKTPLSTIKGFCGLLFEDYGETLDETGRDYLNYIGKATVQMSRLIDDIMSLAKISHQEMSVQEVNLTDLARTIVDEFRKSEPAREAEIIIHDNLRCSGDEKIFRIALINLLGNAWKYTSKKPKTRIEFRSFFESGKTVFAISDNGAGFPMKYYDKLFKPFQRLHSEGEFTGTGIGLATVKRVINRHGGRVWAEAETGKGATFYFTLE